MKFAHKLQGQATHQGLEIAIEHRKGSVRTGVGQGGKPWRMLMKNPYGYIKGTRGADGEEIDCYMGPAKDAPFAYIVGKNKRDGTYDEDKVMLGFPDAAAAKKAYLDHYQPEFFRSMKQVPIERFKEMVLSSKKLTKSAQVRTFAFAEELANIYAWDSVMASKYGATSF